MTKDIKYILTEKEHDELKYKLELEQVDEIFEFNDNMK